MYYKIFKDSLIKNSSYLIVANFFNAFLGIIFWIIASKYYSPQNIGIISAIFSATMLIASISSLGFPTALVYYLPRDSKNVGKIIDSCLIVSTISSILFSLIFISGLKFWSPELTKSFDIKLSIIFISVTALSTISGLMTGVFIAGRKSSYSMFKDNTYHFVKMFFLIIFAGLGIIGTFISLSIGLISSSILGFILLYKTWKHIPTFKFDPIIKTVSKYSFENYIAGIFYNLPKLILPIMILNLLSSEKTGYFYIAIMAAGLLHGISISISSSLLAESYDGNKFLKNINRAILFNMMLLIPGLLFFVIFGKFILNIFNPSYALFAENSLIILSIAGIPISLINIFNTVRNAQDRTMSVVKMNFIVAIITIILAIPLMKTMNIEGASIAYLIANTIGALIVIKRIKNPIEFTLKIVKEVKSVHI